MHVRVHYYAVQSRVKNIPARFQEWLTEMLRHSVLWG